VISSFQASAFKCNLCRYTAADWKYADDEHDPYSLTGDGPDASGSAGARQRRGSGSGSGRGGRSGGSGGKTLATLSTKAGITTLLRAAATVGAYHLLTIVHFFFSLISAAAVSQLFCLFTTTKRPR
jgi:hypothetical protein